ncbi:MAG: class I SAM-dependent methyltransferase [Gammaproteobacteria bacterium]|nr:class I SAM-dependent methyltransferase [Gammaproteobacteria bacterium]
MNISKRLKSIALMVDKNSKVIDVGCDHALLSIYLEKELGLKKILAIDNKEEPLKSAKSNIEFYGLTGLIDTLLSDGLDKANLSLYDTIIMAGLGGDTIRYIMDKKDIPLGYTLILEPNKGARDLREYLLNNGYEIIDEDFIKDKNHYYPIIKAKKTLKNTKYNEYELSFGRFNIERSNKALEECLISNLNYFKRMDKNDGLDKKIEFYEGALNETRKNNK